MAAVKNLILINPVNRQRGLSTIKTTKFKPMALGILAAQAPRETAVHIIDENFEVFEEKIKTLPEPCLVGLTSFTSSVTRAYEIARYFKLSLIHI